MTDGLVFSLLVFTAFIAPLTLAALVVETWLSIRRWVARRRSQRPSAMGYRPMASLPPEDRPKPVRTRITRTRNTHNPNQENQS